MKLYLVPRKPRIEKWASSTFVVTVRFQNGRWLDESNFTDVFSMLKYVSNWSDFPNAVIRIYPASQQDLVKYVELVEEA